MPLRKGLRTSDRRRSKPQRTNSLRVVRTQARRYCLGQGAGYLPPTFHDLWLAISPNRGNSYFARSNVTMLLVMPFSAQFGMIRHGVRT